MRVAGSGAPKYSHKIVRSWPDFTRVFKGAFSSKKLTHNLPWICIPGFGFQTRSPSEPQTLLKFLQLNDQRVLFQGEYLLADGLPGP